MISKYDHKNKKIKYPLCNNILQEFFTYFSKGRVFSRECTGREPFTLYITGLKKTLTNNIILISLVKLQRNKINSSVRRVSQRGFVSMAASEDFAHRFLGVHIAEVLAVYII